MLLLKNPERSKQQTRRFPAASIEQAFLIRRARVSGCLAEVIQWIQSRRALGVISDHNARVFGAAAARAFLSAPGTVGSGSLSEGEISRMTASPASAPAALLSCGPLLASGSSGRLPRARLEKERH